MKNTPNILAVIFLIILLVALTGCGRTSAYGEEGDVDYRKGVRGLEMRLIEDDPAWNVYEGDMLHIGVELFNRGAYMIEEGGNSKLYITGYDPAIISNRPTNPSFPMGTLPEYGTAWPIPYIQPRTQFNEEGGYAVLQFHSSDISLPEGTTNYDIPLHIYACYPYETLASADVCMDPQPHRTNVDKPCWTQDVGMGGGQGAPVAVTYVDVTNMKDNLRLAFTISNVGNGDIVSEGAIRYGKCPTSFDPMDINVISLESVTVGGRYIDKNYCQPNGEGGMGIRLVNGQGKIICNIPISAMETLAYMYNEGTAFITPVEINLRYGYRTYIEKRIQVKGYD